MGAISGAGRASSLKHIVAFGPVCAAKDDRCWALLRRPQMSVMAAAFRSKADE
jgi:hypothetical protein